MKEPMIAPGVPSDSTHNGHLLNFTTFCYYQTKDILRSLQCFSKNVHFRCV